MRIIRRILFLVVASQASQGESIAFPDALEAAAVSEERISEISAEAFPIGNGDLNALLWDRDGSPCLRVSKNDLWDARIDTSQDPPLLKMDLQKRTWSGGIDKVPSWNRFPYPQPRCAAIIRIGTPDKKPSISRANLDLLTAKATLGETTVRVLADRNVFLIDSPQPVALEEIKSASLPPAEFGETGGVSWLRMTMPGDPDYKGMEYALAVASNMNRSAVAMVTSFDTTQPVLETAISLARKTLHENPLPAHEAAWRKFWSASGLRLEDKFFEQSWYRNLYYMRCFSKPGVAMPVCLFAGQAMDNTPWHGAPTLNYNFQQVYWPMCATNHVELVEPYVRLMRNFAPRGRWLAKETYGVNGLFLPLNIFGPEHLVDPTKAKSKNGRQIAYVPWTYTLGCTGWGLQPVWQVYQYAPDKNYLESVYPLIRDGAEFYANVLEHCRDGEFGPSYNPEHGPFGTFNNPVDLAYTRFLLRTACKAASILGRDADLTKRWEAQHSRVPAYETTPLNGKPIIANWKGADANSVPLHNVATPTVPIFPAEDIHWFSDAGEKETFERTLHWLKYRDDNAPIMVNVARARLSMPEAYSKTREHFTKLLTPNGLFAKWPGHGSYLSESWAISGLISEFLLQSAGGIIRVFPAWPGNQDASFRNLRAEGGFLVSSDKTNGKVTMLRITSTVGGELHVLSPWTGKVIKKQTQSGSTLQFQETDTP